MFFFFFSAVIGVGGYLIFFCLVFLDEDPSSVLCRSSYFYAYLILYCVMFLMAATYKVHWNWKTDRKENIGTASPGAPYSLIHMQTKVRTVSIIAEINGK
jgi:hypothetical protein